MYRKPSTSRTAFVEYIAEKLFTWKHMLLLGDMNINLLEENNNYMETVKGQGYVFLNDINSNNATRIDGQTGTKSIIDHVLTDINLTYQIDLTDHCISDHKVIHLKINQENTLLSKGKQQYISKLTNFLKLEQNITAKLESLNTDNLGFDGLCNIISEELEKCNSLTVRNYTKNIKEGWFTSEIKYQIKQRDILYIKSKKFPNNKDFLENFKNLNKLIKNKIKFNKKCHVETKFQSNLSPKKKWNMLKDLIGMSSKTPQCHEIKVDNVALSDKQDIVEAFNHYFVNITTNLGTSNHSSGNPAYIESTIDRSFYIRYTTPDEIQKTINQLKPTASPGHDGLKPIVIKKLANVISPIISKIINHHIQTATFPDSLKLAKVTPIFKKGSKDDLGNYRPISVLPIMSKIFELVLQKRLLQYLEEIEHICKSQHGFRNKRSTLTALTNLTEIIYSSIDNNQSVVAIFLDLCKAFDMVVHTILLQKLSKIGIVGKALDLLESYLHNRQQFTVLEDKKSSTDVLKSGVPQGSILGPLLFLIYINDLVDCNIIGSLSLFADDTAIVYRGNLSEIIMHAQRDLDSMCDWASDNNIVINHSKCNYILLNNASNGQSCELKINGTVINEVPYTKYLGITIDNKLNYQHHIEELINTLNAVCFYVRRNVNLLNIKTKYLIYHSYVNSRLMYLPCIWGQARKVDLDKLQIVQNRCVKIIFGRHPRTSTSSLYNDLKILTIREIIKLDSLLLIYKIRNKLLYTDLHLAYISEMHEYSTRSNHHYYILPPAKNIGQKKISHTAVKWFNDLPDNIKSVSSLDKFKLLVRKFICDNRV
ncbi:hypothetical protein WA026_017732 [Henosepilachna vigintioctopunctata]|uniref:Reverse transcriptase domain-containing protein n=1 Tax=Henosepilachna vigintioctopunctata TaxID=420089 RepID=A0AAW1U9R0_9CUCU